MTGNLPPEVDPLLIAAIEDHFDQVDTIALTGEVLHAVMPQARMLVTRAIDDMFGHIPTDTDGDL
ncbi:hypothetical protein ACWGH4_00440 [Streptomyces sp. NPDC054847]